MFGQNVTEHNPAPSPSGHPLLSGPPTLNDIRQIFDTRVARATATTFAHDDQRPQGPAGLAERWAAAGGGAPRHCHLLPPPPAAAQAVAAACGCGRGRLEQRRGRRAAAEASRAEPLHSRHTARVRQRRATAQAGAAAGTKRRLALGGDRSRLSGPSGRPRLRSGPPLTRSRPRPSSEPPAPGPPLPVSVGPCLGLLQLPTLLQAYSTTSK
jgi:hypothetical protein